MHDDLVAGRSCSQIDSLTDHVPARRSGWCLAGVRGGFFDQGCDFLWMRNVNAVTSTGDFDLVAVGPCGLPTFEVGVNGSIVSGYQHPARFAFPLSGGDDGFEIVGFI